MGLWTSFWDQPPSDPYEKVREANEKRRSDRIRKDILRRPANTRKQMISELIKILKALDKTHALIRLPTKSIRKHLSEIEDTISEIEGIISLRGIKRMKEERFHNKKERTV